MIISTAKIIANIDLILGNEYKSVYGHNVKYASLYEMVWRFGGKADASLAATVDRSEDFLVTPALLNTVAKNLDIYTLLVGVTNPEEVIQAVFDAAEIISLQGKSVDENIDSQLRQSYDIGAITQENAPLTLKEAACNISHWYLYQSAQLEDDHIVQRRYSEAMEKLKNIIEGKINLDKQFRLKVPFENMPPSVLNITSTRNVWGR